MLAELVREPSGVVSVRSAAEQNNVPYSFARSIQRDLVQAGVIESIRGSRGGMRLAADPASVTLLDVVEAVQGPLAISGCAAAGPDGEACPRAIACGYNPIWRGAQELLDSYLSSVTLAEAVSGRARPVVDGRFTRPGESGVAHR